MHFKKLTGVLTAILLFLGNMAYVCAADKNVVCNEGGCSGFDGALFSETNVVPGNSVSKTFSIKNEMAEDISVDLDPQEQPGSDDVFLEKVSAVIYLSPATILFGGFMNTFLAGSDIALGTINPGSIKEYEIELSLPTEAGNEYQENVANFSLSLKISGEDSGTSQVLGTSSSSGSSNSESSGSTPSVESIIGQVLGLSDTSEEKLFANSLIIIVSLILISWGLRLVLKNKNKYQD